MSVGYIESGFGDDSFCVQLIPAKLARDVIREKHYSHTVSNGSRIHLGIFADGVMLGVMQLGAAMNPKSCGSVVTGTQQDEYLELNRLWLDDVLPRNSESRAFSYAVKFIKKAHPKIAWIQSFADERCGRFGVTYQACNFVYCGEHTSTFWLLDGVWYHNSLMTRNPKLTPKAAKVQAGKARAVPHRFRQFRYIYFLKPKFRARLTRKELPYPKPAS